MPTPTVTITLRLTPEELEKVDAARRDIPRERWIRAAIYRCIQAPPTPKAERSPSREEEVEAGGAKPKPEAHAKAERVAQARAIIAQPRSIIQKRIK